MTTRARAIPSLAGSVLLALALLLLARCDWAAPADEQQLVVEAFFVAGEPLGPLTLRTTRPLVASESDAEAGAPGAEVVLVLDEQYVTYRPAGEASGRYVPDTSLKVMPDAQFALTVHWQGQTATASGTVPPPIAIDTARVEMLSDAPVEAIRVDSLRRDSLDIPAEQGYIYPVEVTVSWVADRSEGGAEEAHWVRAHLKETLESDFLNLFMQPEEVFRERTVPRNARRRQWTGVYAVPVDGEDDPLPAHELRVALVRGDSAYAAFATSRNDPARREPISNVQGAIGIATAIALDSVHVEVGADDIEP